MRVLVVDDNDVVRRSISRVIKSGGQAECAEATDGKAAVEKALEWKPDLILLDIRLPEVSGFEAATIIKKHHPEMPILFCSIYDTPDILHEARRIGDGFVLKEKIVEMLPKAVDALLKKRRFFPHLDLGDQEP